MNTKIITKLLCVILLAQVFIPVGIMYAQESSGQVEPPTIGDSGADSNLANAAPSASSSANTASEQCAPNQINLDDIWGNLTKGFGKLSLSIYSSTGSIIQFKAAQWAAHPAWTACEIGAFLYLCAKVYQQRDRIRAMAGAFWGRFAPQQQNQQPNQQQLLT